MSTTWVYEANTYHHLWRSMTDMCRTCPTSLPFGVSWWQQFKKNIWCMGFTTIYHIILITLWVVEVIVFPTSPLISGPRPLEVPGCPCHPTSRAHCRKRNIRVTHTWLVVSIPLKNISQLGWWHSILFPTDWKNKPIMFQSPPTRTGCLPVLPRKLP